MQKPQTEIVSDAGDLARRMTRLFASAADEAVASRGTFYTAISGGHTPEGFFRRLGDGVEAVPWDRTQVFWVDERYVPPDSPASNYRLAAEALLSRVDIPKANIHPIPTDHADIRNAAQAYERTMREVFGLRQGGVPQFDLIVLGMGGDGHTASLFPNAPAVSNTADLACAVHVEDAAKHDRITLTRSVLAAARRLAVLVAGSEKAQTLREVFTGEPSELDYPIRVLWPVLDRVTWLVDREAARGINGIDEG